MKPEKTFEKQLKVIRNDYELASFSPEVILMVIFPIRDHDSNTYFKQALAYCSVTANKTRLKLNAGKLSAVSDLMGPAPTLAGPPPGTNGTPDTWNFVWPMIKNPDTATSSLRAKKDKLKKKLRKAFNNLFADVPDSVINKNDTAALNLKPRSARKKRSYAPPQITGDNRIFVGLVPQGGGDVLIVSRSGHDSGRASKLNAKVDIEFFYGLTGARDAPLTRPQCPHHTVVTKARSLLHLNDEAVGQKLCLYARWYYTKHPERSGQFCEVATTIVT